LLLRAGDVILKEKRKLHEIVYKIQKSMHNGYFSVIMVS